MKLKFSRIYLLAFLLLFFAEKIYADSFNLTVGTQKTVDRPKPPFTPTSIYNVQWNSEYGLNITYKSDANCVVQIPHYYTGAKVLKCSYTYKYRDPGSGRTLTSTVNHSWAVYCGETYAYLSDTKLELKVGDTKRLTCDRGKEFGTVTWSSSNSSVASIDSYGNVTAKSTGTAKITCDPIVRSEIYCEVTVVKADPVYPTGVSLPGSLTVDENGSAYLSATVTPSGATTSFSWSSDDTTIATVSSTSSGTTTVKGIKPGTTKIRVKTDNGYSDYCNVTVRSTELINLSLPNTLNIDENSSETLSASLTPSYAISSYTWWSEDESVATVSSSTSSKVTVSAKGVGTTKIWVKSANGLSAFTNVTVRSTEPTGFKLKNETVRILIGETKKLGFEMEPNYAVSDIDWSSSDTKIATVNSSGEVKAVSEGTATITAKTKRGGFTSSCQIKVISKLTHLIVWLTDGTCVGYDLDFMRLRHFEIYKDKEILIPKGFNWYGGFEYDRYDKGRVKKFTLGTEDEIEEVVLDVPDVFVLPKQIKLVSQGINADGFKTGAGYTIYTINGTTVLNGMISSGNDRIDISTLPSGIYVIKVENQTLKFKKQ